MHVRTIWINGQGRIARIEAACEKVVSFISIMKVLEPSRGPLRLLNHHNFLLIANLQLLIWLLSLILKGDQRV